MTMYQLPIAADRSFGSECGGDRHRPGCHIALSAKEECPDHDENRRGDKIQSQTFEHRGIRQQAASRQIACQSREPLQMQVMVKPPPRNLPRSPLPRRYSAMMTAQFWSTV